MKITEQSVRAAMKRLFPSTICTAYWDIEGNSLPGEETEAFCSRIKKYAQAGGRQIRVVLDGPGFEDRRREVDIAEFLEKPEPRIEWFDVHEVYNWPDDMLVLCAGGLDPAPLVWKASDVKAYFDSAVSEDAELGGPAFTHIAPYNAP